MPPVDWGPIKAAIIPVSDFFTGNGFSENMPAVQAERRIIVMQVASVILPPPFTTPSPTLPIFPPLFPPPVLPLQPPLTKGHTGPVATTCTTHCHRCALSRRARRDLLLAGGGVGYCLHREKSPLPLLPPPTPCCGCTSCSSQPVPEICRCSFADLAHFFFPHFRRWADVSAIHVARARPRGRVGPGEGASARAPLGLRLKWRVQVKL